MFRQAGIIQVDTLEDMFDVAQLLAHQPLPRGRRVAIVGNSDALGLLAADAASAVGLVVTRSVALGSDATAEDFEDAIDEAIDDPEVDSVIAVYIPPLNVSTDEVANVLAAVGEQSDKPLGVVLPRRRSIPELLRAPDVAGSTAGRGSGAVVPGRGGGGARPRAGGRVRRVVAHPGQQAGRSRQRAAGRRQAVRAAGPRRDAGGGGARPRAGDRAARGQRHRRVAGRPGRHPQGGERRGQAARFAQALIAAVSSSRKRSSLLSPLRASAHRCCLLFAQALIAAVSSSRKRSSLLSPLRASAHRPCPWGVPRSASSRLASR